MQIPFDCWDAVPLDPRVAGYEKALKEVVAEAKQIVSGGTLQNYAHQSAQALLASFQSARAGGDLTLELLDQHLSLLALLISGSNMPFSTLASRIYTLLKSTNNEVAIAEIMLNDKIVDTEPCPLALQEKLVSLAKRVPCTGAPRKAIIREDTCADCVWVWQVANNDLLPSDKVADIKKTWNTLAKCASHGNAIRRLLSFLKNSKCKPGTISKAEEAVAKHVRRKELERQKQQNKEDALKKKEQDSKKRKLEQAAKLEEKNKKRKLAAEEKENKKKLLQEEKLKKKQEQEAKARKEKTKGMRSLFSFFAKKAVRASPEKAKKAETASSVAKYVEPSLVENAVAGSQTTSVENLLGKVKVTKREIPAAQPTQMPPSKRQRTEDDVEIVKVQAAPKKIKHSKFFQFEEDRRPPFFGLRKLPSLASTRVSGRRPLEKDYNLFNYDIDSDDEWECANGESLSGSEDDEPEEGDPKENEFRYDGWLCGDNQIDWIQEGDEEESDFNSQDEADADDETMNEEQDEADGEIFKPIQKAHTALRKTEVTFRLVTSVPEPDSNLRNYKAQALVPLPYVIAKPFEEVACGKVSTLLSLVCDAWF